MPSNPNPTALSVLQRRVWDGRLPLEIRLAPADCRSYADSEPYLIQYPRLSYLAFLLPRLHAFFAPKLINPDTPANEAWFEFENVPLKWHYPAGLLYDIHSGAQPVDLGRRANVEASQTSIDARTSVEQPLPWKLVVHYSELPSEQLYPLDPEGRAMRDSFVNAVKEADFIRNGSARTVMGMSKEDSDNLWKSVESRTFIRETLPGKMKLTNVSARRHEPFQLSQQQAPQPTRRDHPPCAHKDLPTNICQPRDLANNSRKHVRGRRHNCYWKSRPHQGCAVFGTITIAFETTADAGDSVERCSADYLPQQAISFACATGFTWCCCAYGCEYGGTREGCWVWGWILACCCRNDELKDLTAPQNRMHGCAIIKPRNELYGERNVCCMWQANL
jgi:hypothetical protein